MSDCLDLQLLPLCRAEMLPSAAGPTLSHMCSPSPPRP